MNMSITEMENLLNDYKVALVQHIDDNRYNDNLYAFKLYVYNDYKVGDIVLVKDGHYGNYALAEIKSIEDLETYSGTSPTKSVICKINQCHYDMYRDIMKIKKELKKIKKTKDKILLKLNTICSYHQDVEFFRQFVENHPEVAEASELLNQLEYITKETE